MASDDTLIPFFAESSYPLSSNPATPDKVGTSLIPVLDYDGTTNESAYFKCIMPGQYDNSSSLEVSVWGAMDTGNTGTKKLKLNISIWRLATAEVLSTTGFASAQSNEVTVENTANANFNCVVSFTNAQFDGVQKNEEFIILITRDNSTAGTNATGDFQLVGGEVRLA